MAFDDQTLNQQFCIPGHISFHQSQGGLPSAIINNQFGVAMITLAGAHVMSYWPHGEREVFWSSPSASYELSLAMRGGIPVCWPWFADHPLDPVTYPIHGLVRTQSFSVLESRALPGGETLLRLHVSDDSSTRSLWPHAYELEVSVMLGKSLKIEWTARNPGNTSYTYTGAFHPYFRVSNVHDLVLRGLEGVDFLDKYDDMRRKPQVGSITFPGSIDNVYVDTTSDLIIEDPGFRRNIHLRKSGSRTTVVWNPYHDDASMSDVGAGQHVHFLCVEAANAAEDVVSVLPGKQEHLSMEIEIETWREG